ncbi:hypothetical protein [Herbaspirillum frisingense]|uniref:Uncharacterized protein n=1 Tax=Herbaspirillum frisingense TaxID=92645 RepID=A0ABU1PKH3_9BURK|nr:hypothetical protein [Herbaspirillum frisingense]MDR6586354.1 hypothetical protein [Herbaspirillum frisingense]
MENQLIAERCNQVLNTKVIRRSKFTDQKSMNIPVNAAEEVADLLMTLPRVADIQNAQARLERLANPVTTFSALWRQYINCGFSSQEKSDPDTAIGRFAKSNSPLMDWQSVFDHGEDVQWIAAELVAAGLNRMTDKKTRLLLSARQAFSGAMGKDDRLVNGNVGFGLDVFLDLASGRASDRDIATSAQFSRSIDSGQLYGIGHKQVRNILVNTGLAHNVVPIDSRWREYVGHHLHFAATDLAQHSRYLDVENVIRTALILVQKRRDDIPCLAVLDASVFAVQSADGHASGGWAGA